MKRRYEFISPLFGRYWERVQAADSISRMSQGADISSLVNLSNLLTLRRARPRRRTTQPAASNAPRIESSAVRLPCEPLSRISRLADSLLSLARAGSAKPL